MTFEIAVASADDMQRMAGWATDEGWNPGNTDFHAFFATDPAGFLVGRLGGEPVTAISVVRYGEALGFLGFYIARPVARGKGYGLKTWDAGMKRLAGRNVGLDGVVAQQSNYRKSGFRLAWNNVRQEGPPPDARPPAGIHLINGRSVPFDKIAAFDRRFFPVARDAFLVPWISLPGRASIAAVRDGELAGFAVMRPAGGAHRVGPLYADSPELAAALVSALARETGATTIAVDVPDINRPAQALAEASGWKPAFETARMYTGAKPDVDYAGIYGVSSFELG